MGLNAKNKPAPQGNRVEQDPLDAGTYPARLVQVIDLGVQEQDDYQGKPKPPVQMLKTTYEFVDEFMKDEDGNELTDKPRWLSEDFAFYSLESDMAKSTKRYFALDPDGEAEGDWAQLLGRPVMITIVQNPGKGKNAGKVFEKITGTSTMRKKEADKLPPLKNEGKIFSLDDVDTVDIFMTLPEWIQKKIKESLEFEGSPMADAIKNYKKKDDKGAKQDKKAAVKKQPEADDDDGEAPFDTAKPDEGDGDW